MWAKIQKNQSTLKAKHGFTVVELLIVIVVIGILAAISIVAYSGIQERARDSERVSELNSINKALAMYYADNGGYPACDNTEYIPGATSVYCTANSIIPSLVPKYISKMPIDPLNNGSYHYYYGVGYTKSSESSYSVDTKNNYILAMKIQAKQGPFFSGWGASDLNYIIGSNN